jgi:hypothetical protein
MGTVQPGYSLEMPDPERLRRILRATLVGSLLGIVLLLAAAILLKSFGEFRTQALFTFLGLAAGAVLGDIAFGTLKTMPRRSRLALTLIAYSQAWYYLIVWTRWKMDPSLWRFWWVCFIGAATSSHLLALWKVIGSRPDRVERATLICAAGAGALLVSLGFHRELPYWPGPWTIWPLAAISTVSVVGSILLWRRWAARSGTPRPMGRWARVSWILASHAALFMAGWYIGGAGQEPPAPFETTPYALNLLSPEELRGQTRADLERLKGYAAGLDDLTRKAAELHSEIMEKRKKESRAFYLPEEDDRIRWQFVSYLSLRSGLLRMVATYAGFESVKSPENRAACFMLGYAAAAAAFEKTLVLLKGLGEDPLVARKLNEQEPLWGIDAGTLDQIRSAASSSRSQEKFEELGAFYEARREEWRELKAWSEAEFAWLDARINAGTRYVKANGLSRPKVWLDSLTRRIKEDAYRPIYSAQSTISTVIGDFRVVQDPPLISIEQIEKEIAPRLRPGDIFLERRNWFMSNAFLPGFWPHSALYVGTIEDLRRLGIADHPEVRKRSAEYLRKAPDGRAHTVIEAVSEGVVFNSITESMHADFVAVLRPRLTETQAAQAIVKAFSHLGKPYDFEFDFFTSDKLVCTELLYRSYEGLIHFDLVRVMGRDTLPALEIARKFSKERGTDQRQFDLVLYFEGDSATKRARLAGDDAFCGTLTREGAFGN